MSKFSKILIFVFLILLISGGFGIFYFSNAQNSEVNVSPLQGSNLNSENQENFTPSTEHSVYVCPNATSLDEINPRCPGKIILRLGETINGMTLITTNYEGKDYYLILGFINGGAGNNLPLVADADGPYQGYGGLPITFNASNSSDPNDDPLQYRWDFDNDGIWDTDWLDNSTTTHIWNNDYEGIVRLEVSDGEFTALATTSVKVISARTFKEEAVDELKSAKTGDEKIDKKIDKIIWFINQSLDEKFWVDDSHLIFFKKDFKRFDEKEFKAMFDEPEWRGPKSGISVFHYEKVAARLMMNEVRHKNPSNKLKDIFEKVIDKLVKADTLLAKVSIFDAKNTLIQNPKLEKIIEHQIAKAEEELNKAEKELQKDRPDKAIMRLSKSWLHSQLAIKFANLY